MNPQDWQVLIVEDQVDSVQLVSKILRHHGVHVEVAADGAECVKMLQNYAPTMIITDLAMPVMDGWEMLAQIRANPDTANIPIIAITAYHSASVAKDALGAGFDAYFSKPLDALSFVDQLAAFAE